MWPHADRRRAFTLVEVMIASALSTLILAAVVETFVVTARAMSAVTAQVQRQSQAGLGLDRVAEILRNAVFNLSANTPQIVSASDLRFQDARNPGVTARLHLDNGRLRYDPDTADADPGRVLAGPLAGLTFSPDPDPLIGLSAIQVQISYNYMSFRDYHPNQSRNATFVTSVFLRNGT